MFHMVAILLTSFSIFNKRPWPSEWESDYHIKKKKKKKKKKKRLPHSKCAGSIVQCHVMLNEKESVCIRKFNNRTEGLEQIFTDIFTFTWSENVTRITPKDEDGFFSITFRAIKSKEIVEMQWENKKNQGKLCYKIVQDNPTKIHELRLGNLPEEVPTWVIQSYLSKYLISPKVKLETFEFDDGYTIEIGEATVTYKGLRRPIPRKPWVGPGVAATVIIKTTTHHHRSQTVKSDEAKWPKMTLTSSFLSCVPMIWTKTDEATASSASIVATAMHMSHGTDINYYVPSAKGMATKSGSVKRTKPATGAKKHTWPPTAHTATYAENMDTKRRTSVGKKKAQRRQVKCWSNPVSKTDPQRRKTNKPQVSQRIQHQRRKTNKPQVSQSIQHQRRKTNKPQVSQSIQHQRRKTNKPQVNQRIQHQRNRKRKIQGSRVDQL